MGPTVYLLCPADVREHTLMGQGRPFSKQNVRWNTNGRRAPIMQGGAICLSSILLTYFINCQISVDHLQPFKITTPYICIHTYVRYELENKTSVERNPLSDHNRKQFSVLSS